MMLPDLDGHWFVLIFRRELVFALLSKMCESGFVVSGTVFTAVDDNFLTAFVDRLVDQNGDLVGIHISPTSSTAEALVHSIRNVPYVTLRQGALQVWLSEAPLPNAHNAAEQAFGGQIFRSASGEYALSIDAPSLFRDSDRQRLTLGHANWAKALCR